MINMSMAVLENEGEIVFLKRLKEGPAAGSYGLHVARLAGVPQAVLLRAKALQSRFASFERSLAPSNALGGGPLDALNSGPSNTMIGESSGGATGGALSAEPEGGTQPRLVRAPTAKTSGVYPAELFSRDDLVLARLRNIDPDRMTPLEALQFLAEIESMLR